MSLDDIAAAIRACRLCVDTARPLPHAPRPVVVPSATARILIAGQAPGTKVHATGLPFNDASGDRLRSWLGVTREQFYKPENFAIAPMGFCFPGQDRHGGDLPPRPECAARWRSELMATMPQIDLVLAIGAHAQRWHLGTRVGSMTDTVAAWRGIVRRLVRPRVLPLPHPSWRNTGWLKRNPWFETELLPFLRAEVAARLECLSENAGCRNLVL